MLQENAGMQKRGEGVDAIQEEEEEVSFFQSHQYDLYICIYMTDGGGWNVRHHLPARVGMKQSTRSWVGSKEYSSPVCLTFGGHLYMKINYTKLSL